MIDAPACRQCRESDPIHALPCAPARGRVGEGALIRKLISIPFFALALAGPGHAHEPADLAFDDLMHGIVQQEDVAVFLGYAREAFSAALEGREPPASDRVEDRAEAIADALRRRGAAAARALLDAIERGIGESPTEPPRPAGVDAYGRSRI